MLCSNIYFHNCLMALSVLWTAGKEVTHNELIYTLLIALKIYRRIDINVMSLPLIPSLNDLKNWVYECVNYKNSWNQDFPSRKLKILLKNWHPSSQLGNIYDSLSAPAWWKMRGKKGKIWKKITTWSWLVYFRGCMGGWALSVLLPFLGWGPCCKTCWANSDIKKKRQQKRVRQN